MTLKKLGALGLACIPGACVLGVVIGLVLSLFTAKSRTEG